jgi:small subunit ribosomal protein S16
MLSIRMTRIGKRGQPYYRLTIAERGRDPYGKALEILGSYDPRSKELSAKNDRINYWISKGAQMTPTVNNMLVEKKIITGEKKTASKARTNKKKEKK